MPIPPNITPSEVAAFKTTTVKQIRGKLMAVLRHWLTKHWIDDFRDDYALQHRMKKFIDEIHANNESNAFALYLAQAFERQKKDHPMLTLSVDDAMDKAHKQNKKVAKFFYEKNIDILNFKPEVKYIYML